MGISPSDLPAPSPIPGQPAASPILNHRRVQREAGRSVEFASRSNSGEEIPQSGIIVYVPEAAKVFVNGHPMKTTGDVRRFASNRLKPGKSYAYELRAEMVRNGKKIVRTERVELKAGRVEEVGFDFTDSVAMPKPVVNDNPDTHLTIVVPPDASVFLDGEDTISVGNVRKFITNDLSAGKAWKDYEVRVEFERNGKTIVKTQKVNLKAGDKQEVEFEVEERAVAASK